jgi:putative Mg2+ transporter-C (MgtC) family protein
MPAKRPGQVTLYTKSMEVPLVYFRSIPNWPTDPVGDTLNRRMQLTLNWSDVALRLVLAGLAGGIIGLNRGEHGQVAGLRTTMMVCLAATVAMILANLLLSTSGKHPDSFVNIDPMRLPLGILTGMGFIGGGVILRRKDSVIGVTTASTLWFVTVVGLCLGSGQLALGMISAGLAMIVLEGLCWADRSILQDRHAVLALTTDATGPTQEEIIASLRAAGFAIASCAVTYTNEAAQRKVRLEVRWRGRLMDCLPPAVLGTLAQRPGVLKAQWRP